MRVPGRDVTAAWAALALLIWGPAARAELRSEDLAARRLVLQGDWLRLRLEVLGLRLSYPAYRIELKLAEDRTLAFTLLASAGFAEHLGKVGKAKAEELLAYHARGIREQVGQLLEAEFPELWSAYAPERDLAGVFLGPGQEWNDPPRTIARWQSDHLAWAP
ncbi:MAG: hypothetical protein AB1505_10080 [Candidatus Latescibacterota bacterium]